MTNKEKIIDGKKEKVYDVIIIGGGPAGLSAAIYSSRYNLKTAIFDSQFGGTANWAHEIENYPGFEKISGIELMEKFQKQAKNLGTEIFNDIIKDIIKEDNRFIVKTEKKTFKTKTIILAVGTEKKKLNLESEKKYIGKGISYCATCDGAMFNDKIVCVIGGSNSAVMAALLLSQYAKKIYLIYRGKELRADPVRINQLKKEKKISIIYNAEIKDIKGNLFVESAVLTNGQEIKTDGIFVEIGSVPSTYLAQKLGLNIGETGYIQIDQEMKTNISGVFACGDVVEKKLKQIITASSDGATAAYSAYEHIKNLN